MSEQSLSRKAYECILEDILQRRLIPGEIVNRREVAKQLGTSVAPVLEAMVQLASEGFLEISPRKLTRVRLVKTEDLYGLLIVREAIECQAARMFCGIPVKKNKKRLEKIAREIDTTVPFTVEHFKTGIRFHRALVELTNCPALLEEFDRITKRGYFYMYLSTEQKEGEHIQLLNGLEIDDLDKAEKVMRAHMEKVRKFIIH